MFPDYIHKIFSVTDENFQSLALDIFRFQSRENKIYAAYLKALDINPDSIQNLMDIPFMPIDFFKFHNVICGAQESEIVYSSSTTTGSIASKHYVKDRSVYFKSTSLGFQHFYGSIEEYEILALLPSYLEREGSSLVDMVSQWNRMKGLNPDHGFYLYDHSALNEALLQNESNSKKTLLIGVSFGLLDFAEQYQPSLNHTIVMETGGMKGRRKEITREELHGIFMDAFHTKSIHSEYGMTELLSQAYSGGEGLFYTPPWMKVLGRELNDPFSSAEIGSTSALNIIDLANIYSCSFIATSDLGKIYEDGSFEVLGRMDVSDTRGCNLMVGF